MKNETNELIKQLAEKLGTTTEYLWSVLIRQAFIEGIENILVVAFAIITLFSLYRFYKWAYKKDADDYNWFEKIDAPELVYIITGVIGVFLLIMIPVCIIEAFDCFLSPEYWALSHVLKSVTR